MIKKLEFHAITTDAEIGKCIIWEYALVVFLAYKFNANQIKQVNKQKCP